MTSYGVVAGIGPTAQSPTEVGIAAAVLTLVAPVIVWGIGYAIFTSDTRTVRALRFGLWPTILASTVLGGPLARAFLGIQQSSSMSLSDAMIGLAGVSLFLGPPAFLVGMLLFRDRPQRGQPSTGQAAPVTNPGPMPAPVAHPPRESASSADASAQPEDTTTAVSLVVGTGLGWFTGSLWGAEVGAVVWVVGVVAAQIVQGLATPAQEVSTMQQATHASSPPPPAAPPASEIQYAGVGWTIVRLFAAGLQITLGIIMVTEYLDRRYGMSAKDQQFFWLVMACVGLSFIATVGPWATRPTTFLGLWFARRAAEERIKLASLTAAPPPVVAVTPATPDRTASQTPARSSAEPRTPTGAAEPTAPPKTATADDFLLQVYTNGVHMDSEDWGAKEVTAATRRRWPDHPRLPELEKIAYQALMVGWRAATPLDLELAMTGRAQDLRHELQPLIAMARGLLAE